MEDRYLNMTESVDRLVGDYKKHGNLYIAFDFDNTVYDFHNQGETYPKIETLLKELKLKKFKLILFTSNSGIRAGGIVEYCKIRGYEPDYINESPVMKTIKPYYSILLDDRAGLREAYDILKLTLKIIENEN